MPARSKGHRSRRRRSRSTKTAARSVQEFDTVSFTPSTSRSSLHENEPVIDKTPKPVDIVGNVENVDMNSTGTKKARFLDIIKRTINQLHFGGEEKLNRLFDNLLDVANLQDSKKRKEVLQIMLILMSNINRYEDNDIADLKRKIESKFIPAELRKLAVDENALKTRDFFFGYMGSSRYCMLLKGSLTLPDGSKTDVVIKRAKESYFKDQLIKEAKHMARLEHGNILKILAFNLSGPVFAVEYMKLGNLSEALQVYRFTDAKLVDILREVAAGMEYIASKGYIHRDLKCRNIFLNDTGVCKIGEFDLCECVGDTNGIYEDKNTDLEEDLFLSPETRKTGKFTTKTDVWAFGLVAWEVYFTYLSTHNPLLSFEENSLHISLLVLHLTGILENRGCPSDLWSYLKKFVLNRDPERRQSFSQIKTHLDAYLGDDME